MSPSFWIILYFLMLLTCNYSRTSLLGQSDKKRTTEVKSPLHPLSCSITSVVDCVKKNQLDAQLILSIFRQPLHVSDISRPIIRRYNCLLSRLAPTRTTDSHLKKRISASCCIHRLYLLMMGRDTPETCRGWRNILSISCASSWFFFTQLYRDAWSTKHEGCCQPQTAHFRSFNS